MPKTLVLADKHPIEKLSDNERLALLDDVIARYGEGDEIMDIAHDAGVSDTLIYRYLLGERQEQFRIAQVARAMTAFEQAASNRDKYAKLVTESRDQFVLNKSNTLLRYAESVEKRCQWLLERCLPKLYGQDKAQSTQPVAIQINVRREADVVVDLPRSHDLREIREATPG